MGNDASWLRWHRLYGLSSEVKASIDGRLIRDIRFEFEKSPSGGFLFSATWTFDVAVWHQPDMSQQPQHVCYQGMNGPSNVFRKAG
jgi:hypothetical protein